MVTTPTPAVYRGRLCYVRNHPLTDPEPGWHVAYYLQGHPGAALCQTPPVGYGWAYAAPILVAVTDAYEEKPVCPDCQRAFYNTYPAEDEPTPPILNGSFVRRDVLGEYSGGPREYSGGLREYLTSGAEDEEA